MHGYGVLVIGGYGFFGRRLIERLARQPKLHVVVAGRSRAAAKALVADLRPRSLAQLEGAELDAMSNALPRYLATLRPAVVVHTSGPFQGQDYRVAEACAGCGAHYVDLADGHQFVSGFDRLEAMAVEAGVTLVSGASTVPALSSAVVDRLAEGMSAVHAIDIGISPGNRTERGLSTMAAVLSYCGKPLPHSGLKQRHGWMGTWRHHYPAPVGPRLLSPCDVPDLGLLPRRYPGSPTIRFGAGLELRFLHRAMNLMAWAARAGLVRDWSKHAPRLKRAADLFRGWGTQAGAMHVSVSGVDVVGAAVERKWVLIAGSGDGPYVPTLAAAALVRKLAAGQQLGAGARPCLGMVSLAEFLQEATGLDIQMKQVVA